MVHVAYLRALVTAIAVCVASAAAADVAPRTKSGVCEIRALVPSKGGLASGSGFLVNAEAGLVITNWHVLAGASRGVLSFEGSDAESTFDVVGYSVGTDLAVLRIDAGERDALVAGRWQFTLADDATDAGCTATAIGYPGGWGFLMSRGVVLETRAWGQALNFPDGAHILSGTQFIAHTCRIARGSSGGPLVDADGDVIGINTFGPESLDAPDEDSLGLAVAARHARELIRKSAPEHVVAWARVEELADTVSDDVRQWSIPKVKAPRSSASSTMRSIRAVPHVAACTRCRGDGDVFFQRTVPSGRPLAKGTIYTGEKTCSKCGGDGYRRDWDKVTVLLGRLTEKVAGLDESDPRYGQAVQQFFQQLSPVMMHSPRLWARLVNGDCFERMKTPRVGRPIFGVGACSETFDLVGIGRVTVVVPVVDTAMTRRYLFVTIAPHVDIRTNDDIQYAFWGGIIAAVEPLTNNLSVVFLRRGFLMTP